MSQRSSCDPSSRRPVFGDVAQINALKSIRAVYADEDEKRAEGKKEYRVTVEYSCEDVVTVWAKDEDEAEMLAKNEADVDDGDWTCRAKEILPE